MANEAVEAASVDSVDEPSGTDAATLDDWANQPDAVASAADAAPGADAAPKPGAKKGADALAAAAEAGKKGAAPAKSTPAKQEAKPALPYDPKAKVKVSIDGEESEVTLDEVIRGYRKNAAADRRFQEASKLRQEAESLKPLEAFKGIFTDQDITQARNLLRSRNLPENDPHLLREAVAEIAVQELIEREKLQKENPAELARREEQRKREEAEAKLKAREEQEQQAEQERKRQEIRAHYDKEFTAALTEHDLPATPRTIMRMAEVAQENLRLGIDLPAGEIAKVVREDIAKESTAMLKSLTLDQALKFLPKDFLDALRKYDLEKAKGSPGVRPKPPAPLGPVPERRPRGQKFTRTADADAALEKWANGG